MPDERTTQALNQVVPLCGRADQNYILCTQPRLVLNELVIYFCNHNKRTLVSADPVIVGSESFCRLRCRSWTHAKPTLLGAGRLRTFLKEAVS